MAKAEWGGKHRCRHCGKVFYDLCRSPILCPACGETHQPETLLKSRRSRADEPSSAPARVAKPAPPSDADTEDDAADEGTDDPADGADTDDDKVGKDDVIEDSSELGEDGDDVAVVVEKKVEDGKE